MSDKLIEASMHLECLNDAWNELWFADAIGLQVPDDARKLILRDEIACRIWAAIYLIQSQRTGQELENHQSTIDEANRYNGGDFGEGEPIQGASH